MPFAVSHTEINSRVSTLAAESSENGSRASKHPVLVQARHDAETSSAPYAGGISPLDAHALFAEGVAALIDVRTSEERKFVGHVPGSLHVAWQIGTALTRNPRFVRELEGKVAKDAVVLFLCRSGKRSAAAAEAATKAGFSNAYNVLEGFEGDLDNAQQRGSNGGWRLHGLPWVQD
jgi:rhodanese-related sulfurtransferase